MNIKAFARLRTGLTAAFLLSLLVVLAGATVRATGSGMGCPDWPLCYGCWIPPVSADQLPADFAERFAVGGQPAEFDAVKTWIEYVNRLLGAVSGLAILIAALLTLPVARRRPWLPVLAIATLAVLALVAWLGAKVVDTVLAAHAVTVHLLAAYALLGLILAQREMVGRALVGPRPKAPRALVLNLVIVGLAFALQWLLGIRTREEVEAWIWNQELARAWWDGWAGAYDMHKVSAVAVGLACATLAWTAWRRRSSDPRAWSLALLCGVLVASQAAVGLILWFGELPLWAKPLHLLFATGAWAAWAALVFHCLPSGERRPV